MAKTRAEDDIEIVIESEPDEERVIQALLLILEAGDEYFLSPRANTTPARIDSRKKQLDKNAAPLTKR